MRSLQFSLNTLKTKVSDLKKIKRQIFFKNNIRKPEIMKMYFDLKSHEKFR